MEKSAMVYKLHLCKLVESILDKVVPGAVVERVQLPAS
jgi:hypothetical protein